MELKNKCLVFDFINLNNKCVRSVKFTNRPLLFLEPRYWRDCSQLLPGEVARRFHVFEKTLTVF